MFGKQSEDGNMPAVWIVPMGFHWSHVALFWNWESKEFETTSQSKIQTHRHKREELYRRAAMTIQYLIFFMSTMTFKTTDVPRHISGQNL